MLEPLMTSLPRTRIEGLAPEVGAAPHLETAVSVLKRENVRRVLVLGRVDGAVARRLHGEGLDIVLVDCASRAADLARAAKAPGLEMLIDDSVESGATFDAVVADMQDGPTIPAAYLATDFWEDVKRLLRPGGLVLVNVTDELHAIRAWSPFQRALATTGFTAMVLSPRYGCGNRLLVTSRAR
jgi:spermidine synthase